MTSASTDYDLSSVQPNIPSIVLPYVFTNVTDEHISKIIGDELELGTISSISRIVKTNHTTGYEFNVVFIHFEKWNTTDMAEMVRKRLLNDQDAKIYHDQYEHFWKARAYVPKEQRGEEAKKPDEAKKARIEFD